MASTRTCFACGSSRLTPFYEQASVPVNSGLLLRTRAEALGMQRGDIRLAWCGACGFIQNLAFDAGLTEYSPRYEHAKGYSVAFGQAEAELANRLVKCYDLHHKSILEIGCGRGDFLRRLCRAGGNWGLGIDPASDQDCATLAADAPVAFVRDFYSESSRSIKADFVCCRQTLEHVQDVQDFMGLVRGGLDEGRHPVVYFEVPDAMRSLRELAFWDVHYEHCSYFSLGSLARLFRASGFDVLNLKRGFLDQALMLEAVAATGGDGPFWEAEDDLREIGQLTSYFAASMAARQQQWARQLQNAGLGGGRSVLWGAGSKAVAFVNAMREVDAIDYVVDINPRKQGCFLAGSGTPIVPPDFLCEYRPDTVIATNRVYLDEIRADLDRLGVRAELTSL